MKREINYVDLFSGQGGFALGLLMAGFKFKNHWYSEVNEYGQKLYGLRFPGAVGLGDIRGIRGRELGAVDILTGGFPCQPFSVAGQQRGAEDDRHLWPEMFRVIKEVKSTYIIAENVTGIIKLALDEVLSDLESESYTCQTLVIPACAVNAPHRRDRIWIVAYNGNGNTWKGRKCGKNNSIRLNIWKETETSSATSGCDCGKGNATDTRSKESGRLSGSKRKENSKIGEKNINAPDPEGGESRKQTKQKGRKGFTDTDFKINTNSNRERLQRRKQLRQSTGKFTTPEKSWESNWLEVATSLCGVDARFSDWMDGYFDEVIKEKDYVNCKKDKGKNMQILWEAFQSKEIRETIRGLYEVDEPEILFGTVRQLKGRTGKPKRVYLEGEEAPSKAMQLLWDNSQTRRSPQRREHQKQLARKLIDIVPQVPYEIALEVVETGDILWGAYKSIHSVKTELDGLKLSKSRHRIERLKSLGNSVVPQIVAEIGRSILETN